MGRRQHQGVVAEAGVLASPAGMLATVLVQAMAKRIDKEPGLMVLPHLRVILKKLNQGMYSKWIFPEAVDE